MVTNDTSLDEFESLKREIRDDNIEQLENRLIQIETDLRDYKNRLKFAQEEYEDAETAFREAEVELRESQKFLKSYRVGLYDIGKKAISERIAELKRR